MYFKVSWHQDFADLMHHLWGKYGREIFTENGIGDQLDLNKFSQNFFNNKTTTADISIDANANVGGKSVIDYAFEFPKPIQKYNSHYLLWKSLKASYGLMIANEIIEKQISGEIYINDFSDIGKPYSYHPHTVISTSKGNMTMEKLFHDHRYSYENTGDMEEINNPDFTVLDGVEHVNVSRILRHKSHTDLLRIETKRGSVLVVTEDHPFITKDHPNGIRADNLKIGDEAIRVSRYDNFVSEVEESYPENNDLAYLIGAMIGDGHTGKELGFTQKDITTSHFYEKFKKIFKITVNSDKKILIDSGWKHQFEEWIGKGAKNKHLPDFYQKMTWEDQLAMLAGIIDSDGTINKKTGVIDIRVTSFALVQQLASLLEHKNAFLSRFSRIRTSCVGGYSSDKSFESKLPMYRVSFVCIPDEPTMSGIVHDLELFSVKVNEHRDVVFKDRQKDGRWDSDQIHKIEKISFRGEWVYDITTETGRFSSNGLKCHNCFNFSTYDVALEGLSMSNRMNIKPPKSLESFIRQMEQFTVYAANSTLGATGLADVLIVASHYVDKIIATGYDGNIHIDTTNIQIPGGKYFSEVIETYVSERIRSFIYTLNWEFRGNQSPFTNLSVYDDNFLDGLVKDYTFPDYGSPKIETVKRVQEIYIEAMNSELKRSHLTFPVTTAAFYVKDGEIQDRVFLKYIAEQNLEFGFINIYYGDTSTLSSCCRLRSSTDNEYFNSFGAGSTKIGSLGVVTSNLPRLAYLAVKTDNPDADFTERLKQSVEVVGRINHAKRNIIKKRIELGAMPLYTLGHMDLSKQYSTYGVTGLNEALEVLGYDITSEEGEEFVLEILDIINDENDKMSKRFHAPHNCEQVPAESSAVKLAKRDFSLGYNREEVGTGYLDNNVITGQTKELTKTVQWKQLYSNQFIPLTTSTDMLDRLRLQGKFDEKFSGGAICHINIGEQIKDVDKMIDLMIYSAKCGTVYWAVNYALKRCENGHIFIDGETCPNCGKGIDTVVTRVVGFFTNVANWNEVRREFDWGNRQFYKK